MATALSPTLDNNRRLAIKQAVVRALTPTPNDTQHTTGAAVVAKAKADLAVFGGHRYCYAWPPLVTMPYNGSRPDFPWCAAAVVRWFVLAGGVDLRTRVTQWAYCPALYKYFAGSPYWITVPATQAPVGGVVIYLRNGVPYHIGITTGPAVRGILPTIEGDTSSPAFPGSDSTGGVMASRSRNVAAQTSGAYSMRIWRPRYIAPSVVPAPKPIPITPRQTYVGVLRYGDSNVHVRHLQQGARDHLKSTVTADGVFGPHTLALVKAYQKARHLSVDGVVGPATGTMLARDHIIL